MLQLKTKRNKIKIVFISFKENVHCEALKKSCSEKSCTLCKETINKTCYRTIHFYVFILFANIQMLNVFMSLKAKH